MRTPHLRVSLLALLLSALATGAGAAEWQPPNILVVLVDDAGLMDFGGYGGEARTPTIDRIADQGVRCDQAAHLQQLLGQ